MTKISAHRSPANTHSTGTASTGAASSTTATQGAAQTTAQQGTTPNSFGAGTRTDSPTQAPAPPSTGGAYQGYQGLPGATPTSTPAAAPNAARTPGGLPLAETHMDIPTNATQLSGRVGRSAGPRGNRPQDVQRVQQRLHELGFYQGEVNGQYNDATEQAIRNFQRDPVHRARIREIQHDARNETYSQHGFGRDSPQYSGAGRVTPNDATHQALANAFPRTVAGRMMNEQQAYNYYQQQIEARGLPFNPDEPNIVGIRGYQGGGVHTNPGSSRRNNQYNDTMILLTRGENGEPRVREFRATVDPGAHEGQGTDRDDPLTVALQPDQQITYQLSNGRTSHADRPGLFMRIQDGIVRPGQTRETPNLSTREDALRPDGTQSTYPGGIMIHAGGGNDNVEGSSYACQVVNGNWYPNFFETLERSNPENRRVQYTILDGQNLTPPQGPEAAQ